MERLKSIFGSYADKMQVMVDNSLDRFAPTWHQNYFTQAPAQVSLNFESVIGQSRIEAAASVVDRNAGIPLRSRAGLAKLSGSIPAIKEGMKMQESDMRDFLAMQNMPVAEEAKKAQLLAFMFNDIRQVGSSTAKRLDIMCLQAVSTGQVDLSATNNPDGIVAGTIDLLMPSANKVNSAVSWDSASATPLTVDIPGIVATGRAKGVTFAKMLMTPTQFINFQKITEVKNLLSNFLGFKQSGTILATLDNINTFLQANRFPVIELVDEVIGIEKDGVIETISPFKTENVSFVPAGPLGVIKNAIAIEQIKPVAGVAYATLGATLISKWSTNNPWSEITAAELNAFPAFEAIDATFILVAVHA
ncbi:major capsid protein [Flaviaesturariibacter amylovorans]|uniref:Phage capsid protein n=1 Tax=Flaviaesturariibacter amylovorans TaxID=1084520 RepID=A0ABP8GR40_9BACT